MNNQFYWTNVSGTSANSSATWYTTYTPYMSSPSPAKEEKVPESALEWLDRRVDEITDLVSL